METMAGCKHGNGNFLIFVEQVSVHDIHRYVFFLLEQVSVNGYELLLINGYESGILQCQFSKASVPNSIQA